MGILPKGNQETSEVECVPKCEFEGLPSVRDHRCADTTTATCWYVRPPILCTILWRNRGGHPQTPEEVWPALGRYGLAKNCNLWATNPGDPWAVVG